MHAKNLKRMGKKRNTWLEKTQIVDQILVIASRKQRWPLLNLSQEHLKCIDKSNKNLFYITRSEVKAISKKSLGLKKKSVSYEGHRSYSSLPHCSRIIFVVFFFKPLKGNLSLSDTQFILFRLLLVYPSLQFCLNNFPGPCLDRLPHYTLPSQHSSPLGSHSCVWHCLLPSPPLTEQFHMGRCGVCSVWHCAPIPGIMHEFSKFCDINPSYL